MKRKATVFGRLIQRESKVSSLVRMVDWDGNNWAPGTWFLFYV